jgi:hypothetical protein
MPKNLSAGCITNSEIRLHASTTGSCSLLADLCRITLALGVESRRIAARGTIRRARLNSMVRFEAFSSTVILMLERCCYAAHTDYSCFCKQANTQIGVLGCALETALGALRCTPATDVQCIGYQEEDDGM